MLEVKYLVLSTSSFLDKYVTDPVAFTKSTCLNILRRQEVKNSWKFLKDMHEFSITMVTCFPMASDQDELFLQGWW